MSGPGRAAPHGCSSCQFGRRLVPRHRMRIAEAERLVRCAAPHTQAMGSGRRIGLTYLWCAVARPHRGAAHTHISQRCQAHSPSPPPSRRGVSATQMSACPRARAASVRRAGAGTLAAGTRRAERGLGVVTDRTGANSTTARGWFSPVSMLRLAITVPSRTKLNSEAVAPCWPEEVPVSPLQSSITAARGTP